MSKSTGISPTALASDGKFIIGMKGGFCNTMLAGRVIQSYCKDVTIHNSESPLVELYFTNNYKVMCTADTEFLCDGGSVPCKLLHPGDIMFTSDDSRVELKSFQFHHDNDAVVSVNLDAGEYVELSNHIFVKIGI